MEQMVGNLINCEGGENLVFKVPEPRSDNDAWTKGTNSAGGSLRSIRIVMPLGMALDILQKADLTSSNRLALWSAGHTSCGTPRRRCVF